MLRLKLLSEQSHWHIAEHFFNEVKENFPVYKEFNNLVKAAQGHTYIGLYNEDFQGVLFLHRWNLAEKKVFIGGFSKRKSPHTVAGLKLLTQATFQDYPVNVIFSETHKDNRPAHICLKRAGYKFIKEINDKYLFSTERTK